MSYIIVYMTKKKKNLLQNYLGNTLVHNLFPHRMSNTIMSNKVSLPFAREITLITEKTRSLSTLVDMTF